jgi:hypothetical protein
MASASTSGHQRLESRLTGDRAQSRTWATARPGCGTAKRSSRQTTEGWSTMRKRTMKMTMETLNAMWMPSAWRWKSTVGWNSARPTAMASAEQRRREESWWLSSGCSAFDRTSRCLENGADRRVALSSRCCERPPRTDRS